MDEIYRGGPEQSDKFQTIMWHIHYSEKYNYVYVDTPKAACSTIKRTLWIAERGVVESVRDVHEKASYGYSPFLLGIHDRRKSPLKWPEDRHELVSLVSKASLTFCFVRNPFTRVLSTYLDKISPNVERRTLFLRELGVETTRAATEISFVGFLELVAQQRPEAMNAHWRPQSFHLIDVDLIYDFIGRFEAFSRDFSEILQIIDPQLSDSVITVDEHRTSADQLFSSYYSDPICALLVREIYAEDFERFGYSDIPLRATEVLPPTKRVDFPS